jgi:Outer membrane cobalamin receptor protein
LHKKFLTTGVFALALVHAARAEETAAPAAAPTVLERMLVTAGLTPVEEGKTGRAFTVITGEELQRSQIDNVADALRRVPGVAVSRMGPAGGLTQVRMRGAESNHVLVMIDGIEVLDPSGESDLSSLLIDEIDRIEVLRGPQSAFWGSNATAGVINIITRRGTRDGFRIGGRAETGSDGTWLGGVNLSGGGETYDIALSALRRRIGGFNVSDFGTEKDGDDNTTLNGRFTFDLTPDLVIDGTLRHVDRKSALDAQDWMTGLILDTDDEATTRETFGSLGATLTSFDGALTQKARLTGSDISRDYFAGGARTAWTRGNRVNGTYQATFAFDTAALDASHKITGGYEWERETFLPSHLTTRFDRVAHSFVGEYRGEFADQVFLNAALRHDVNDRFADATTYSLSAAWAIPNTETRLHASVGTGVTNPTFFEQFGYVPTLFVGNPNLKPEESFGWDIGVEQGFFDRRLVVDVTYFDQDLTNEIAVSYAGPLPTPVNRDGKSKRRGVEIAANVDLMNGLTFGATYTYTHATEQATAGGLRTSEIRRPRHSGSVNAAYVFAEDKARVFGEAVFSAGLLDTDFVTYTNVRLKDYAVFNVGASYRFNEHLEAYAKVENLFDTEYEEVLNYNTQGRTAYFGLRGSF